MDWIAALKTVAPTMAAALGGPIAGGAVKYLADNLLGNNAEKADIEQYVMGASPEQLSQLKKLDLQYKTDMAKLGVDVFALEVKDRDSARKHHKDHWMPALLCMMLTLMVAGFGAALMFVAVPPDNDATIYMLFGHVSGAWLASIAYWTGTTKSSGDKTKLIQQPRPG